MRDLLRSLPCLLVLVLGLLTVASPARADVASTVTATADALVRVQAIGGSVSIVGSSRSEVSVRSSGGDAAVSSSDGGSRVQVQVSDGGRPSLDITVPSGATVEVFTVEGGITVKAVTGPVRVETVQGSIEVSGGTGDVEARTISGHVRLSLAKADVRARSVSGEVDVALPGGGTAWVKSVSGVVHLDGAHLTRIEVHTVSGETSLAVDLQGSGPFTARTHGAAVHVIFPRSSPATIEAHSSRGTVRTPDGGAPGATDGGRPVLSLYSFSGAIDLQRR
jgi:DUF4097 and DUF4098 domain-containing protein YvlB